MWTMLDTSGSGSSIVDSIVEALRPLGIGITGISINMHMDGSTHVVIEGVYMGTPHVVVTRDGYEVVT